MLFLNTRRVESDVRFGGQGAKLLILGVLSLAGIASCASSEVPSSNAVPALPDKTTDSREDAIRRLDLAEAKWKAAGIDDYSYRQRNTCSYLCPTLVTVVVRGGRCKKVSAPGIKAAIACEGMTIPEQLASVRSWANDNSGSSIRVVFDKKYGFPTEFFVQTNMPGEYGTTRIEGFSIK